MPTVIFHVGMGKTGSTTLQAALAQSAPALAAGGYVYLGQWMNTIREDFDQFKGFQKFLRQSATDLEHHADQFVNSIEDLRWKKDADKFIVSNEQYLENVQKLEGFFKKISQRVEIKILIFLRPPATWLPSAYVQWGVIHKTNLGPLQPFRVKARELMRQYDFIRYWREIFGSEATVRLFDDNIDVVQDMSRYLGVELASISKRYQSRPTSSDALIRGAFNNLHQGIAFPDAYSTYYGQNVPAGTPRSLREKFAHVFDVREIPQIIKENAETLSYLEREFGLDMQSQGTQEGRSFDLDELTNELLGTMLDLVFSQAHQIERLSARVEKLERRDYE